MPQAPSLTSTCTVCLWYSIFQKSFHQTKAVLNSDETECMTFTRSHESIQPTVCIQTLHGYKIENDYTWLRRFCLYECSSTLKPLYSLYLSVMIYHRPLVSYSPFHHIMMQHGCTADWLLTSLIEFKHRTHNDRSKDTLTLAVPLIYTKPAKTTYNLCL